MRVKTWRILDYGMVSPDGTRVPITCRCGYEAEMPVKGRPLAVTADGGVIFDNDEKGALPTTVQCRKCGRILTTEEE